MSAQNIQTADMIKRSFVMLVSILLVVFISFHIIFTSPIIVLALLGIILLFMSINKPVVIGVFSILLAIPIRPQFSWFDAMITFEGVALLFAVLSLGLLSVYNRDIRLRKYVEVTDYLFFGMVASCFIAYCHNPALPSFAWFGGSTNVSGFAQWVN